MAATKTVGFQLPAELIHRDSSDCVIKPVVVISGCLSGQAVRYDGSHKSMGEIVPYLRQHLTLIPFCPEVAAGLGTPREPIQRVVTSSGQRQVQQVNNPSITVDQSIIAAAESFLNEHQPIAAITKARSPSCGSGTTPIYRDNGTTAYYADGLFIEILKREQGFSVVDEAYFKDSRDCHWFILGCYLEQLKPRQYRAFESLLWKQKLTSFLAIDRNKRERVLDRLS